MKTIEAENNKVTRGHGFLEILLARQRAKVANRLIPEAHRKGRILDIGCGSFPFFLINAEFFEKHGLDKLANSNNSHCTAGKNILISNFDLEKERTIPYGDGYFNVITMLAVFEHIDPESLTRVLNEIYRVLKPGGMYILTTPAAWADPLLRVLAKMRLVSLTEIEEHKDAYTHGRISSLLQEAGFQKEKMRFGYFELYMNIWAAAVK
jgi:ubiquinone/menaquinone biosynthesis C-methylase UbiE